MEFIRSIPKPRKIFIEEGELASWLLETSLRFGEQMIITDPRENKRIIKAKQKIDLVDATKTSQLASGGYIKEIYHPLNDRRRFKKLVFAYRDTVKSQTRVRNKIKACFRREGIKCSGDKVYYEKYRAEWKKKIPKNIIVNLIIDELWVQLDQMQGAKEKLKRNIRTQARKYSEVKIFMELTGIGLIHVASISAILEMPHRFANKKKEWVYAGIGLTERGSGDKIYSRQLTREFNRPLKNAIKQATEAAIHCNNNPLMRQYLRLSVGQGVPSHKAKLTVARSLLSTL